VITPPTTNAELYALIERIAVGLDDAGDGESARRLRFAVKSGSTSGEIFSNLGAELSRLLGDVTVSGSPLRDSIAVALDVIDAALRRVGQFPPPR
jgi:hypothetical protein